jgi:hypothetical protein
MKILRRCMMKRLLTFLFVGIVILTLGNGAVVLGQEGAGKATVELPERGGAIPELPMEPETQWVWGEVASVDKQSKMLIVKYLDYETDQEKQLTVVIDDKTAFENIRALDDLKPLDTVSIDYLASSDGKNLVRNISVEKPENTKEMREGTPEAPQCPSTGTSAQ